MLSKTPWILKMFLPKQNIYDCNGSLKFVMNTSTKPVGNIFLNDLDELRKIAN